MREDKDLSRKGAIVMTGTIFVALGIVLGILIYVVNYT